MKVLFLTRTMFPDVKGGGDVSAFEIAKAVALQDGVEAVVCCLSEKISEPVVEVLDSVKIYRFPWRKWSWFPRVSNLEYCYWQLWRVAKKVQQRERPDCIHFLNFSAIFPLAFGFSKLPKFATCNGPWFCLFGGAHHDRPCCRCSWSDISSVSWKTWGVKSILFLPYALLSSWLLRRAVLSCNRVFPVSGAMERMLIENGVSKRLLSVIHNPVSVSKRSRTLVEKNTILSAGRLSEDKGVRFVIRALPLIPKTTLVIVGRGRFEGSLRKLVNELGLENRVEFLGFVDGGKLKKIVARAGVNVLLGTVYEALPRSVLEASALSVPSVVSSAGGNGEAVGDGGIVVRSLDEETVAKAIQEVLQKREKYGRRARVYVQKGCSPIVVGKKLAQEYERLAREVASRG